MCKSNAVGRRHVVDSGGNVHVLGDGSRDRRPTASGRRLSGLADSGRVRRRRLKSVATQYPWESSPQLTHYNTFQVCLLLHLFALFFDTKRVASWRRFTLTRTRSPTSSGCSLSTSPTTCPSIRRCVVRHRLRSHTRSPTHRLQNYLRDWQGGSFPSGWANKPVTWVSIDDAAAYCEVATERTSDDVD